MLETYRYIQIHTNTYKYSHTTDYLDDLHTQEKTHFAPLYPSEGTFDDNVEGGWGCWHKVCWNAVSNGAQTAHPPKTCTVCIKLNLNVLEQCSTVCEHTATCTKDMKDTFNALSLDMHLRYAIYAGKNKLVFDHMCQYLYVFECICMYLMHIMYVS